MRIQIIGTTGSGKSTLAAQVAAALGCPHVELDAFFWGPDWTPVPREHFLARVEEATAGEAWVVDGNYSSALGTHLWDRADMVVWLDFPLHLILWRLGKRTLRRAGRKEDLWGTGNRETWRKALLSRESILLWAIQTHKQRRARYVQTLADPAYGHVNFVRLTSPRGVEAWMGEVLGS
jgi:adenylate kinase family enzyme